MSVTPLPIINAEIRVLCTAALAFKLRYAKAARDGVASRRDRMRYALELEFITDALDGIDSVPIDLSGIQPEEMAGLANDISEMLIDIGVTYVHTDIPLPVMKELVMLIPQLRETQLALKALLDAEMPMPIPT
jgi:hypothetical protein